MRSWWLLALVWLLPGSAWAQAQALDGARPDHGYGGFTLQRWVASGEQRAYADGGGVSFRAHGAPHLALDLGVGVFHGVDAQQRDRRDVPLTLTALLYPFPRSALQFYLPAGFGYDRSRVALAGGTAHWSHFGSFLGLGAELYLTSQFSIFLDLKGFVRWRVGGDAGPEFQATDGRATNTSGGAYTTLGIAWYPLGKNAR